MQGSLFDNVFFPDKSKGFLSSANIALGEMVLVRNDVCEWIKESCKHKCLEENDLPFYGTEMILKYCYHRFQNAFFLANMQSDKCMTCDKNGGFAFNIGLLDKETNDEIVMYCIPNSRKKSPPFQFQSWMRKSELTSVMDVRKLENPFVFLKKLYQKLKEVNAWEDDVSDHFRDGHLGRISKYTSYQLVQALKKSLRNLKTRPDRIEPYVYEGKIQFLVPLLFDYGRDYELYAVCSIKIEGNIAFFYAITKLTKGMVRQDNLLTLFDGQHVDWMNPANDNVEEMKQISEMDPFDKLLDKLIIRDISKRHKGFFNKLFSAVIKCPEFIRSLIRRKGRN